ncbi:MAG TPA: carboxypeptidase-like regulatory domain-containing protein, partial [Candidatus Dormibacteraeota bacterium]|nr:carboxypeptidase-like regulatory domain-containing protein [Candidatus Dormibacteraeota bacterium]
THAAVLPGESEFAVSLDAGLPLTIDTGRASFSLPVPAAGSARLSLTVPGERANVQLNHGIITHRSSAGGDTEVEATLRPGKIANIWWNTREVVAPATPREVRFVSDVKSLISVTESDLQIAGLIDVNVLQGEPEQFSIAIPSGFEVTAVNGATLESSEMQNGALLLKIASHSPGTQQFLVTLERPLNDSQSAAPIVAVKDAQRETGEVLVEGQGTLELTAQESGGLKRLDLKEINPYLRALSRYSLQAAFRYHRQQSESPALALSWTRFPDSGVLAAIAEHATITTLVTSEGKSLTEVKLIVKNQAQPFLKVSLPAGATILTAEVAGGKVKPVQGVDGNRVPLLRAGFHPAGAYTVSFVFLHSGAPFSRKGDGDISLPKMDVPIGVLEWELFLPEQFKVKDFSGDAFSAALLPAGFAVGGVSAGRALEFSGGTGGGSFRGGVVGGVAGTMLLAPLNSSVALATGQLAGQVIDQTGAAVGNARVEVQNLSTGFSSTLNTSSNGFWLLNGMASGTYSLTATAPGFRAVHSNLAYDAVDPKTYSMMLQVGSTADSIEVESTASTIDADTSTSHRKDKKHKEATAPPPTASANVFNLQQRVAGVLPVAVDVPRTGSSYRFVRPLVVNEETKLSFTYKSK